MSCSSDNLIYLVHYMNRPKSLLNIYIFFAFYIWITSCSEVTWIIRFDWPSLPWNCNGQSSHIGNSQKPNIFFIQVCWAEFFPFFFCNDCFFVSFCTWFLFFFFCNWFCYFSFCTWFLVLGTKPLLRRSIFF